MTLADIKNKLTALKPELHERFGVLEIGVFGSWVREEQTESSDIDVLVSFDRLVTLFEILELQFALEDIFERKVDVAVKGELKKYIGQHIMQEVEML